MKLSAFIYGSVLGSLPLFANAWLPEGKIRGVNLGGLFVVEPWMMQDEWSAMGCGGKTSEFDCVLALGQTAANAAFQAHWNRWITHDDITQIASLGLNTVRIPLGYWIYEDIVYSDSEHFPQGAFQYLERVCMWARDAGLYIILDLHGAPGAQQSQQPFTGQYAPTAGFYVDYQYERAYKWLEWITNIVHTNSNFANVGTIQLVNEPIQNSATVSTMISQYYPTAFKRIRAVESGLGITANNYVHIQMMNEKWGSGNPNANLDDTYFAFYDDHHYVKWTPGVTVSRDGYMRHSCTDDRSGNWPVITGEWSISVADSAEWGDEFTLDRSDAVEWYRKWWAAQFLSYEKIDGWVYWNWKVNWIGGRNDWRWGYQQAVAAGVIPTNPLDAYSWNVCAGYT